MFRKKFLYLFILFLSLFFIACNNTDLKAPKNLAINDGVLTWDAVDGAESYIVVVNENRYDVTVTTYNLKNLNLSVGTYQVTIIAVKGKSASVPSEIKTYVVVSGPVQLAAPTNLNITAGQLSWNAVENAQKYEVVIGNQKYEVTATSFNLGNVFLPAGEHQIKVRALAGTSASNLSSPVTFTVNPKADLNTVYSTILSSIELGYTPGMTREDFENDHEYEYYLETSAIISEISRILVNSLLTEEEAEEVFSSLIIFAKRMRDVESFEELGTALEDLALLDQDPQWHAYVLYELTVFALDFGIDMLNSDIVKLAADKAEDEEDLNDYLSSPEYLALYNKLVSYTNTQTKDALDDFLENIDQTDLFTLSYSLHSMIELIIAGYDYAYYFDYDPDLYLFYQIFKQAQAEDDLYFLEEICDDINAYTFPLMILYYKKYAAVDAARDLAEAENTLEILENFQTLLDEQGVLYQQSVETVFAYLQDLYQNIPATLYASLDLYRADTLTLSEVVILKDEIVALLQDSLPAADDFTLLWEMQFHIAGIFTDMDIEDCLEKASLYGQLQHLVLNLGLEALEYIDEEKISEIQALTTGLYTPGEYDPVYDESEDPIIDYHKLIDLILHLYNYYQEFRFENAATFALLEGMPKDELLGDLFALYFNIATSQIPAGEQPLVMYTVGGLSEAIPDIITAFEAGGEVLELLLEVFDTTEGVFFHDLVTFIEETRFDMNVQNILTAFEELIDEWQPYQMVLVSEIGEDDFENLLSIIKLPFKNALVDQGIDFDALYNEIEDDCIDVLMNLFELYQELYQVIDSHDFNQLYLDLEVEYADKVTLLMILDTFLSEENIDLIEDTIEIIAEDILKNDTIKSLSHLTDSFIDEYTSRIADYLAEIIEGIDSVMALDFKNFSAADKALIDEVMDLFKFSGSTGEYEEYD
jgi:hypothetical protein